MPAASDFDNSDNLRFYNSFSHASMLARLEARGLADCKDIELLSHILRQNDCPGSLFWEIGAAFGRVVDAVLARTVHVTVEAWEYSRSLQHLLHRYRDNARVSVNGNLLHAARKPRDVDVALWMFSGIFEFPRHQQAEAIGIVRDRIKPRGYFVVDISCMPRAQYQVPAAGDKAPMFPYVNVLEGDELCFMMRASGFEIESAQSYQAGGVGRMSYVFRPETTVDGRN